MGTLTTFLQQEFIRHCPTGWTCTPEARVLTPELESLLGYSARADVLLKRDDDSRRLWIEFEVSRADPVANHAKFATSHLFRRQSSTDIFVSMVSSHVARGRANLAANMVSLMRHIGMNAFQTLLLPEIDGTQIKELNHLNLNVLQEKSFKIENEVNRALVISETLQVSGEQRLHFAGNLMEVMLNLRHWNVDIQRSESKRIWGRRTVTYFVYEPRLQQFAPSKFCAYIIVRPHHDTEQTKTHCEMTFEYYDSLQENRRFDGRNAWNHLVNNLGMVARYANSMPETERLFGDWLQKNQESVTVHPDGPVFILPPAWY